MTGLLVSEGDTVDVGVPIIAIDDGLDAPPVAPTAAPAAAAEESGERVANLVGYGAKSTDTRRRPRKPAGDAPLVEAHEQVNSTFATDGPVSRRADHREALQPVSAQPQGAPLPAPGPAAPETVPPSTGAVLAKPPVRKLAPDLGVDLGSLTGTGTGGVITRGDVESAAQRSAAPSTALAESTPFVTAEDRRIPIKGVRKATAAAMVQSAFTAPHVTVWVEADVTATMELVSTIRARRDFADVRSRRC